MVCLCTASEALLSQPLGPSPHEAIVSGQILEEVVKIPLDNWLE